MNIKEKVQRIILLITYFFALSLSVNVWALDSTVYLNNTSIESINIDEPFLRILVSYPGLFVSGVCSIEIVADSYFREKAIRNLVDELNIISAFGSDEAPRRGQIVSDKTVRFNLIRESYVDGIVIRPKDESLTLRGLIEKTLGKNRKVVAMPRSC